MSYQVIKSHIPDNVTLVAVSKTKSVADILEIYNQGQRIFGENKVQELCEKQEQLPNDIKWHQIGHLQTNKVKYIAPFVEMIHAVDSLKLLQEINKQAQKNNRKIDCLIQFHIAQEETKFGLSWDEVKQLVGSEHFKDLKHVNIRGVMGMASFTDDKSVVTNEFRTLKSNFDGLKTTFFNFKTDFDTISMGMSGDYKLAIEEGSTMVRVGSAIFGNR